ncbi:MAG: hypothetical protein A2X45_22285 [Lentisphaerae bacterium GWF2_50_93]|nr:MAG: hypothetical protein A2X45_22285 [Lentisphaerae bacterium GWF2_50_93]
MFSLALFALIAGGCGQNCIKELNVTYGKADGQELKLDVFSPVTKSEKPRPAAIIVHGGAWSAGDRRDGHEMAPYLAKEGIVVFCIGYRLVNDTGNRWPAQLDDNQRAMRWVRAHASQYGIDPNRIAAMGGSAGGHIVACMGTSDTRDNSDPERAAYSSRPNCVVMMCGPTDLTEDFSKKVKQGEWCNEQIRRLLGGKPEEVPELANSASPLFHVDVKTPPTLICQGRTDELVPFDHAERFDAALRKAGVESVLFMHKGGHGFDEDGKEFMEFIKVMDAFLKKHLKPQP